MLIHILKKIFLNKTFISTEFSSTLTYIRSVVNRWLIKFNRNIFSAQKI